MQISDKDNCPVFPPGTDAVLAMSIAMKGDETRFRRTRIVNCWASDEDECDPSETYPAEDVDRFGKAEDTGAEVEIFEDGFGGWVAVEVGDDDEQ